MRYAGLFLALPFLSAAQNINWDTCAYQCVTPDTLSLCPADSSCICKLDEGKYWPELLMCLQQNCPAFMAQYQEQFDNLCKPVGPSTTPVYVNTTTTASSSLGGNKTVSSTQQPIKTKTTLLPSKTQSENATTTTIPTQTKPSSSTVPVPTGSAAAAVTLEGVIKWPFAIAVGLAAAL